MVDFIGKLNEDEINKLEKIAEGIDKTLDITDLYLTYNDFLDLNKIIVKLKEEVKNSE